MADATLPTISVIIPVAPDGPIDRALSCLADVDYPQNMIEIIVAEGKQPSRQRNEAAKHASGEILYFLDNDSEADIDLFRFVARSFNDPQVAIVGGPSEVLPTDSFVQKCFGFALGSYFGTTSIRCRYKSIGRAERIANENHLILCNMGVRREVFLASGGFDEKIYPNEENVLINQLVQQGYKPIYNPRAVVCRPHRTSFGQFVRQLFTYGRGRADHFLFHPQFFSPLHTIPLWFTLYVLSLLFFHPLWYFVPSVLYAAANVIATQRIVLDEEDFRLGFVVPFLFPTIHFSYAAGMVWGLLKRGSAGVWQRHAEPTDSEVNVRWQQKLEARKIVVV